MELSCNWTEGYNIAPSQNVVAVVQNDGEREAAFLQWGLIPSWSKDGKGFINARSETIEDKPSFSESFQRRRCLIPADGFYEWQRLGKIAQPYFFHMRDESLFAFAGIWDEWQGDGKVIASCAIITTTALIPFKRQKPILDEFVDRLRMNPGASGFIIAYGRWALAREALKYLTETHGLETARLGYLEKPRKGKFTVKFFWCQPAR